MTSPVMTATEADAHQTFIALMWALSHPGSVRALPVRGLAAFGTVADALVDLETSYFTDHAELSVLLAASGPTLRLPRGAMYQFYPTLRAEALTALGESPVGTYEFPDESATLVLGCALGEGRELRLSGPGINGAASVWVGGIPEAFWPLRARACRHPLGWDVFLLSGSDVVGLPRTTRVEVE